MPRCTTQVINVIEWGRTLLRMSSIYSLHIVAMVLRQTRERGYAYNPERRDVREYNKRCEGSSSHEEVNR